MPLPGFGGSVFENLHGAVDDAAFGGRLRELAAEHFGLASRNFLRQLVERRADDEAGLLQRLPNPPITRNQLVLLGRDNVVAEGAPGLADLGVKPHAVEAVVPGYLKRFRPGGGRRDQG